CAMSPDDNGDIKFIPTLEVTLPDLSNLPRTTNGQADEALLAKYGISIQPKGDNTYLAYVPVNLIEDPATGEKVAFSAKLLYQAGATWQPQQVRLVWMVNVLNEAGAYEDAEDAAKTIGANNGQGENEVIMLHAYDDAFYLTGINVHEARGVQMAVVYEDPTVDTSLNDDDGLFQMAFGLDNTFLVNRDCDFVDNEGECVGDGERDITIDEIYRRWNHPTNSGITENQRWGIPDQLRVQTHTFAHDDQAVFETGGEIAPQILANFAQTDTPNLLFAQENRFRALNMDGRNLSTAVTWTTNTLTFNFHDETVIATAGYNIAPYRYNTTQTNWEPFPIDEYAEKIEAEFNATTAGLDSDDPDLKEATAYLGTLSIVVTMQGDTAMISNNANNSNSLSSAFPPNNPFASAGRGIASIFTSVDFTDNELRAAYLDALLTSSNRVVQYVRFTNQKLFDDKQASALFGIIEGEAKIKGTYDKEGNLIQIDESASDALKNKFNTEMTNSRKAFMIFNAILMAASLASILAMNLKNGQTAGQSIALVVGAVSAVTDAIILIRKATALISAVQPNYSITLSLAAKIATMKYSLTSVSAKSGLIGAAIGIAINWVVFFAVWGATRLEVGSVAFNTLLAGAVAAVFTAVITFFVSLTVVGAIILAIFAVLDLITFIICKAGAKGACDLGIMQGITQALTDWIYQGEAMLDLDGDPAITQIDGLGMSLASPEQGLVAGNQVRFSTDLLTFIRHTTPKPSVVYHYGSFFTREDLTSSTIIYNISDKKVTLKPQRFEMTDLWGGVRPYTEVTNFVPAPGVGWLVPTEKTKTLWQGGRVQTVTSDYYDLATPQINQKFPIWLNTGLALPQYNCWFSVCSHRTMQSPSSTDLSDEFVLDVLPATLDEFYLWAQLGPQIDRDGDGIPRFQDPDDSKWDTDGDGLNDLRETEFGSDPTVADKDGDGLNDAAEIRHDTNPNVADTDG
ncbi:MAG: hypothetical protein KDE51_03225, partial [Anaerolineales bacterium]|nr:hypothetical protein [Anaerolineales bacterium]